jgi:uncharacterized membrane protein YqaE (UPF0057 family)
MKQFKFIAVALLGTLVLGACSTSNEVVGGGIFQKRKYTGGVYWDRTERVKTTKAEKEEEEFDIFRINEESQKKYVSSTTIYNEDRVVASSVDATPAFDSKKSVLIEATAVGSNSEKAASTSTVEVNKETKDQTKADQNKSKELTKKKTSKAPAGDVNTILLVILAIIIPPLAVFLFEGASSRFWIDLILALIGWGVGFWLLGGLGWICGLAAIIYALLIVLGVI